MDILMSERLSRREGKKNKGGGSKWKRSFSPDSRNSKSSNKDLPQGRLNTQPVIDQNLPTRGVIDTIAGGPAKGDSRGLRKMIKRWLRQCSKKIEERLQNAHLEVNIIGGNSIPFSDTDLSHIQYPERIKESSDYPMVVTIDAPTTQ